MLVVDELIHCHSLCGGLFRQLLAASRLVFVVFLYSLPLSLLRLCSLRLVCLDHCLQVGFVLFGILTSHPHQHVCRSVLTVLSLRPAAKPTVVSVSHPDFEKLLTFVLVWLVAGTYLRQLAFSLLLCDVVPKSTYGECRFLARMSYR